MFVTEPDSGADWSAVPVSALTFPVATGGIFTDNGGHVCPLERLSSHLLISHLRKEAFELQGGDGWSMPVNPELGC